MPLNSTRGAASVQGFALPTQITGERDPYFSYVRLLAHMNGVNGSSAFVESSGRASLIANGSSPGATLSNVDPVFGDACLRLPNSAAGVVATMAERIGVQDFTIEMRVKFDSIGPVQIFYDQRGPGAGNANNVAPCLFHNGTNFSYFTGGSAILTGGTVAANTWATVALCRVAGTTRLYINNSVVASVADTRDYVNSAANLGCNSVGSDSGQIGYQDEIRLTLYGRYSGASYPVRDLEFLNQ